MYRFRAFFFWHHLLSSLFSYRFVNHVSLAILKFVLTCFIMLFCKSSLYILNIKDLIRYILCKFSSIPQVVFFLKILFIFREKGREGERERNINVWLPPPPLPLGTWPATQACALTGNWTSHPLVRRPALSPLSHTSQGTGCVFNPLIICLNMQDFIYSIISFVYICFVYLLFWCYNEKIKPVI